MYGRDYLSQIERTGGVEPTVGYIKTIRRRDDIYPTNAAIRVLPNLTLECDDGVCAVPQYIRLTDEQARELLQSLIEARSNP